MYAMSEMRRSSSSRGEPARRASIASRAPHRGSRSRENIFRTPAEANASAIRSGVQPAVEEGPGLIVQGRDRHADFDRAKPHEEVDVPEHQRGPREDGDRPVRAEEDFQRVSCDPVFPFHELVRIRRRRDGHEASRKSFRFLREDGGGVPLDHHRRSPFRSIDLEESRDVTERASVVAADVRVERVVDPGQRVGAEGLPNRCLADREGLPG